MGRRHYVARTQPGLARVAEAELGRPFGDRPAFPTLLPLSSTGYPVFGPYIFIQFDVEVDYWEPINGVRGIKRLMPLGLPDPLPLPEDFISELRQRMKLGQFEAEDAAELAYSYSPHEPAKVLSGAWEGHVGNFNSKNKGFINLSLVLFNRPFIIPIPAHQVRPASPKAA